MLLDSHKVWYLREILGARLVAYILEQDNTLMIRRWANVESDVDDELVRRVDLCVKLIYILIEKDSASTVQNWFMGYNPYLNERSPAWMIQTFDVEEIEQDLTVAANEFAATAPKKGDSNV